MFPSPTAEPAAARMNMKRLDHMPRAGPSGFVPPFAISPPSETVLVSMETTTKTSAYSPAIMRNHAVEIIQSQGPLSIVRCAFQARLGNTILLYFLIGWPPALDDSVHSRP